MANDNIPVCQGPDPDPRPPSFAVPPGACDTHAHVFEAPGRYPMVAERSYTPPEAPLEAYEHLHRTLGIDRGVLVQPSVYGTDNSAMLDAMAQIGPRLRGVAVVEPDVSEAELARLDKAGVRGVRVNLLFKGGVGPDAMARLAARVGELGWHLQLLIDISTFPDLAKTLGPLPVDLVVDHMGHMKVANGLDHPGFRDLLALVRDGRAWVKLSGAYRTTGQRVAPYDDVDPFARALIEAGPERMVWGSDWPHPMVDIPMPNDGEILDLLARWAPDEDVRRKILVDNPAALYGF